MEEEDEYVKKQKEKMIVKRTAIYGNEWRGKRPKQRGSRGLRRRRKGGRE